MAEAEESQKKEEELLGWDKLSPKEKQWKKDQRALREGPVAPGNVRHTSGLGEWTRENIEERGTGKK